MRRHVHRSAVPREIYLTKGRSFLIHASRPYFAVSIVTFGSTFASGITSS
ncbi:unnamed protein product [Nesidiocoris tenuis]|uniref:Uncharacterized protein n=1 Tax=Nesidiocoris tenuis TaxID=355587 RepID=A0A6H5GJY5_9HEMI|nr:unnamed protein product [Nesidiocoris tenuis]CAB0008148.1 unnamed protein product [Nesidiocoris tenuis]